MSNLAQDWMAWIWVVKASVIVALIVWLFYDALALAKESEMTYKQRHKIVWHIALKLGGIILVVVALFMFYGPGSAPETPAAEDDGHHKMVMAREVPPESEIRGEAKEKKEEYLKKIEQGPEEARKEADDYIKKALERSKK